MISIILIITVFFEPDEDSVVNEKSAPVFVTDDAINEATEQVFVVELHLVSSLNPASVDLTMQLSSLCRIIDNHDCKLACNVFHEWSNLINLL